MYLRLLTISWWGSSDELKRLHPSGQAKASGSTTAVRMGGATRFKGCGHTIFSALISSSPLSSVSCNLIRLVLISEVGGSAAEISQW